MKGFNKFHSYRFVIYFINVSKPDSGIFVVTRSYYDYFRNNSIDSKWINLQWDKNINFGDNMIHFKSLVGSGYSINIIRNRFNPKYKFEGIRFYTDHRLMPTGDENEFMVIHDFFEQGPYIDKWKKKKVIDALKSYGTKIITNSHYTSSLAKNYGLNVLTEFYPPYLYNYNPKNEKKNMIISVGSNAYRKRPDLIIDFLNKLDENWTFVRIGGDLSVIGNINTKANYIFRDHVTLSELNSFYDRSMFLFLPSEDEGLGLPMIEALHHDVMVIGNIKNKVLEEFSNYNAISIQDEGNFHLPDYPDPKNFETFKNWYHIKINEQFKIIEKELKKIELSCALGNVV